MSQFKQLLENVQDPKCLAELAGVVESARSSRLYELLLAVKDHMIAQQLRAGGNDLIAYGRIQGTNGVIDFLDWMVIQDQRNAEAEKQRLKDEKAGNLGPQQPPQSKQAPAGYGAI